MINEFGELIEDKEILKTTKRVMKFPPKRIDLLWYKCGWIDSCKKGKKKALTDKKVAEIKEDINISKRHIGALLHETPKGEVLKELSNMEHI